MSYWKILDNIKAAAATDKNTPVTGPHCDRCYRRTHCEAWLLPAGLGETALAPFTQPTGLTKQNAAQALSVVKAMKDAIEVADARLKDFARANGGIEVDGKIWAPATRNGRRSVSLEKAEAAGLLPALEEAGCVNSGGTYEVFSWKNSSAAKRTKKGPSSDWLENQKK